MNEIQKAFVPLIGMLALASWVCAQTPQPPILLLTSQENGIEPENSFSCSGVIHGYLTFLKEEVGSHTLESIWIGPKGSVVQHSRDALNYPSPGHRTAAIWLRFSKEGGLLWNPLAVQRPEDADRLAYDGPWKVEVRWDDQLLVQSDFKVHCKQEVL